MTAAHRLQIHKFVQNIIHENLCIYIFFSMIYFHNKKKKFVLFFC